MRISFFDLGFRGGGGGVLLRVLAIMPLLKQLLCQIARRDGLKDRTPRNPERVHSFGLAMAGWCG